MRKSQRMYENPGWLAVNFTMKWNAHNGVTLDTTGSASRRLLTNTFTRRWALAWQRMLLLKILQWRIHYQTDYELVWKIHFSLMRSLSITQHTFFKTGFVRYQNSLPKCTKNAKNLNTLTCWQWILNFATLYRWTDGWLLLSKYNEAKV